MTTLIHLDFETRSECDIKLGVTKYAMHPSTEVLCMAIGIELNSINVLMGQKYAELTLKQILIQHGHRDDIFFVAHNASFERAICRHVLGVHIPIHRWICTAAMARHFGLPGSLDGAAAALKMPLRKGDNTAMMKLCKPLPESSWVRKNGGSIWHEPPERFIIPDLPDVKGKPHPYHKKFKKYRDEDAALFEQLYAYCKQDVEVERQLFHALPPLPPTERRLWVLDAKINQRGIPVDVELARICDKKSEEYVAEKMKSLPKLTGGAVQTPKQTAAVLSWLHSQGVHLDNLQAQTVQDALTGELPEAAREVLEIRQATAGNAHSKFSKFVQQSGRDGRVRDSDVYYGSHTGRSTSEGAQTKNMMRPEVKDAEQYAEQFKMSDNADRFLDSLDLVQKAYFEKWNIQRKKDGKTFGPEAFYRAVHNSLVRACIEARPGKVLIAEDFSSIEARGTCWLAGAQHILDAYFRGEDLYKRTASWIFGVPEAEIQKDSLQRLLGKKTFLGGGYGIGADKFLKSCLHDGVKIEEELAETCVKKFREMIPEIPALWREFDDALRRVFIENKSTWIRDKVLMERKVFNRVQFMTLLLPSGRVLYYPQAEYKQELKDAKVYGDDGKWTGEWTKKLRWSFSYFGRVQGKGYGRVHTWGGGLTENVVQAFCRDLLCSTLLQVDALNVCDIIMHVYDEIVVEVDEDKAEDVKAEIERIMRAGAPWSAGMPIDCEGWVGKRYKK